MTLPRFTVIISIASSNRDNTTAVGCSKEIDELFEKNADSHATLTFHYSYTFPCRTFPAMKVWIDILSYSPHSRVSLFPYPSHLSPITIQRLDQRCNNQFFVDKKNWHATPTFHHSYTSEAHCSSSIRESFFFQPKKSIVDKSSLGVELADDCEYGSDDGDGEYVIARADEGGEEEGHGRGTEDVTVHLLPSVLVPEVTVL